MRVTLEFFGYLSWYTPGQAAEVVVEVAPGTTVRAAVAMTGVPPEQVAFGLLGDAKIDLEAEVVDGQRIVLLPLIGGG